MWGGGRFCGKRDGDGHLLWWLWLLWLFQCGSCPERQVMQRQSLRLIEFIMCVMSSYSLPFIMHPSSHVQLVHKIPDIKANEESTEHTSPFCGRTQKNTSGFEFTLP